MSPKQPKGLYRELASSRFISNFKNVRNAVIKDAKYVKII